MSKMMADIVILKDGGRFNGFVMVKVFSIKTPYGILEVKKRDIHIIHYKNPPQFLVDEAKTSTGPLKGDIVPIKVPVRPEGGSQTLPIDKKDIHSLLFFTEDRKSLSPGTKKLLLSIK